MRLLAATLRHQALTGVHRGEGITPYLLRCAVVDPESGAKVLFTRDSGHHTSGWLKNPDYERCWHLSISFPDPVSGAPAPFDARIARLWVELMFGAAKRHVWEESPKSPEGIALDVRHYRVFCDAQWQPITPRGEVYSTAFTELGWKSWSEVQAHAMDERMKAAL